MNIFSILRAIYNTFNKFAQYVYLFYSALFHYVKGTTILIFSVVAGIFYFFTQLIQTISQWLISEDQTLNNISSILSNSGNAVNTFLSSHPLLAYASSLTAADVGFIALQLVFSALVIAVPVKVLRMIINLISPFSSS